MPPHPHIEIEPDREAALVRVAGTQFAIYERFAASITPDDPKLPTRHLTLVVESGRLVCDSLALRRRAGGPALTTGQWREVSVPESVRLAADEAAHLVFEGEGEMTITLRPGDEPLPLPSRRVDDDHVATPISGATRTPEWQTTSRRRGERITDETLEEVARIYRQAQLLERPPTNAVAKEMHVARSTAGKWVARARKAGFLGPAPRRGIAGEQP
jgi:hypothetical protein